MVITPKEQALLFTKLAEVLNYSESDLAEVAKVLHCEDVDRAERHRLQLWGKARQASSAA